MQYFHSENLLLQLYFTHFYDHRSELLIKWSQFFSVFIVQVRGIFLNALRKMCRRLTREYWQIHPPHTPQVS